MRNTFKSLLNAGVAISSIAVASAAPSATASAAQKPNVVFILVDDLSYFGVTPYGAKSVTGSGHFTDAPIATTNINDLAEEGVLCSHAYAHALSEATRVALMTGMNNGRNFIECKSLHHSQITFGDVFQREGYATGMYGKWKQTRGTKDIPGVRYISEFGWDDYACFDVITEGQRYLNPELVINDEAVSYKGRTDVDPETGRRWYGPDIFNRKALQFIEKNQDRPFFVYYSMVLIHDEHRPTPDSMPQSVFDNDDESTSNDQRKYFPDMIAYTDKMIGKVVDKIEELGLRENTLIVVMGDNGSKEFVTFTLEDGSLHMGGKGHTRYSGEQVPLIFSRPGTIPTSGVAGSPRTYEPAVDLTDIYPTLIKSCGLEIPNPTEIDGVSLWPQLTGESSEMHRECIYKWYNANTSQEDLSLAVRYAQTPDFKYYAPHENYPNGRFFDLRTDSLEREGVRGTKLGWENYWYAGLDIDKLTPEQQEAYEMLSKVTQSHEYKAVSNITIDKVPATMGVGQKQRLNHIITPSNATRIGVIWESSDNSVATVNKFGEVTALKPGKVTITLRSWDDSWPVANGSVKGGYLTTGISNSVDITIEKEKAVTVNLL